MPTMTASTTPRPEVAAAQAAYEGARKPVLAALAAKPEYKKALAAKEKADAEREAGRLSLDEVDAVLRHREPAIMLAQLPVTDAHAHEHLAFATRRVELGRSC